MIPRLTNFNTLKFGFPKNWIYCQTNGQIWFGMFSFSSPSLKYTEMNKMIDQFQYFEYRFNFQKKTRSFMSLNSISAALANNQNMYQFQNMGFRLKLMRKLHSWSN